MWFHPFDANASRTMTFNTNPIAPSSIFVGVLPDIALAAPSSMNLFLCALYAASECSSCLIPNHLGIRQVSSVLCTASSIFLPTPSNVVQSLSVRYTDRILFPLSAYLVPARFCYGPALVDSDQSLEVHKLPSC